MPTFRRSMKRIPLGELLMPATWSGIVSCRPCGRPFRVRRNTTQDDESSRLELRNCPQGAADLLSIAPRRESSAFSAVCVGWGFYV
jgi:hypothetical protein